MGEKKFMDFPKSFIQKTKEYTTCENYVSAPYFRKSFNVCENINSAQLTVCGLGFYELYVNGKNITKGLLAPYVSNPDVLLYYDTYDIKSELKQGKNVIALVLGNGFLNNPGGNVWDFDKATFRDAPKLALRLDINGEKLFESDESFVCACSPIIFDDYRMGEHYDAREEIKGWNEIDFDDSNWQKAIIASTPKGEPKLCTADPIRVEKEMAVEEFYKAGDGYLYKFPQNNAGVCRLKVRGKRGQKIVLTHGEVVDENGLTIKNLIFGARSPVLMHKDVYICKGEGEEVYTPRFTYHGFQYVFVEGITDEQATRDLLTYVVFHSDIKSVGSFECSDEILNKIQDNIRRSDVSNFHYFPTDCPQREKNGWTGDIALSAEQIMLNFSAQNSFKVWLDNLRAQQKENGQIMDIIPTTGWGEIGGPSWDSALMQTAYHVYKYTGNRKILEDNIGAMRKYLRYAKTKMNENGLFSYGLGDWVQINKPANNPDTPKEVTNTLALLDCCMKTMRIMDVLNDFTDYNFVNEFATYIKKRFREVYVENGRIKDEYKTQTAISMSIYIGIFEKSEIPTALAQLLDKIKEDNDHFNIGVLGSRVLFRVLSIYGYADLAYKLITQKTHPSYANQILSGKATTLWETFVDTDENGKPKKGGFSSLNHHFWGDVSAWFYKYLCGININPNLKDPYLIEIEPKFVSAINYAKAEREYMGEKISVEWRRVEGKIDVRISASSKFKIVKKY